MHLRGGRQPRGRPTRSRASRANALDGDHDPPRAGRRGHSLASAADDQGRDDCSDADAGRRGGIRERKADNDDDHHKGDEPASAAALLGHVVNPRCRCGPSSAQGQDALTVAPDASSRPRQSGTSAHHSASSCRARAGRARRAARGRPPRTGPRGHGVAERHERGVDPVLQCRPVVDEVEQEAGPLALRPDLQGRQR